MKLTKGTLRRIIKEEKKRMSQIDINFLKNLKKKGYGELFKAALKKAGKPIPQMSDSEKKEFFNKIDKAWKAKNEELVGNQHKLDVDGDGEIEASDLAALRAKKDESVNEDVNWNAVQNAIINFLKMNTKILDKRVQAKDTDGVKSGLNSIISGLTNAQRSLKLESVNEDTKKRFDVDFYKGNGDRQTSHEEIIRGDKFSDVVSQATKVAKSKGMNYVEFYHKDSFIGSIDKRNGYQFKKGRNYQKSPLPVNEAKSQDPTLKEMVKFLKSNYRDEEEFSILLAIYFYSEANHGGMRSNLYSALSQLSNKMRVRTKFSDERGTEIEMMVDDLVDEFGGERP